MPIDSVQPPPSVACLNLQAGSVVHWTAQGPHRLSREAFWALTDRYSQLIANDARTGGFTLIVARTSLDTMALFTACICSGRQVSLFPPSASRQDSAHYVEQQREAMMRIAPGCILTLDDDDAASLGRIGGDIAGLVTRVPRLSAKKGQGSARNALAAFQAALDEPARILFWQHSSGTTGIKKAVGVTSSMLLGQFGGYWPEVQLLTCGSPVRIASWLPLYHDMGLLTGFLLPLLGGADLAVQDPFDWIEAPANFLEMIEAEQANVCWMPNFAYRHFARLKPALPQVDLSTVAAWVSCSEPCRHLDAQAFEAGLAGLGVRRNSVVGCYAMAETVFAVTQLRPAQRRALVAPRDLRIGARLFDCGAIIAEGEVGPLRPDRHAVTSSGKVIEGLEVAVFVDGARVEDDQVYGEIGVRGHFVFGGYRSTGRDESGFNCDGFFMTGDLGVVVDGHVFVFGRIKEIIIINGRNIYAGDVEEQLGRLEGVKPGRVVVFGMENPRSGSEDLVVVAEKRPGARISDEELVGSISATVNDAFQVAPFDVRLVDRRWLVKSTSGKISRQSNQRKYLRELEG